MQTQLNHFRSLSTTLDSALVAYNAAQSDLRDRINAAASVAERIAEKGGDAATQRAEVRRLKQERAALKAPSFIDPLADVEQYAKTHANAAPVESTSLEVSRGQTPLAMHNNAQEKTNKVIAELGRVVTTPSAPEDLAKIIMAQLDAIATPPRFVNGQIDFPRHVIDSNGMAITVVNTAGLLAALHRDALAASLLKQMSANGPGITAAERGATLDELCTKLGAALRLEAAAAMAAEQAGQRVVRRRHVHPAILLGLKVAPGAVWDWMSKKRGA